MFHSLWFSRQHFLLAIPSAMIRWPVLCHMSVFHFNDIIFLVLNPFGFICPIFSGVMQMVVKLLLTVSYILLGSYPQLHWVLVLIYLCGCSYVAWLYTWHLPYYNAYFNQTRAAYFWFLAWAGVCMCLVKAINNPEYSGTTR